MNLKNPIGLSNSTKRSISLSFLASLLECEPKRPILLTPYFSLRYGNSVLRTFRIFSLVFMPSTLLSYPLFYPEGKLPLHPPHRAFCRILEQDGFFQKPHPDFVRPFEVLVL